MTRTTIGIGIGDWARKQERLGDLSFRRPSIRQSFLCGWHDKQTRMHEGIDNAWAEMPRYQAKRKGRQILPLSTCITTNRFRYSLPLTVIVFVLSLCGGMIRQLMCRQRCTG